MDSDERDQIERLIRAEFEQSLNERIDRYLSIGHQPIVANHHFADASTECVNLFRDGYFTACITLTQSVAEGIVKFVRERNGVPQVEHESKQAVVERMRDLGILSQCFVDAVSRIRRSFRDDFHHMNPKVAGIELEPLARRNIADLAAIEREIFECRVADGRLVPERPLYWDVDAGGDVPVYLRWA